MNNTIVRTITLRNFTGPGVKAKFRKFSLREKFLKGTLILLLYLPLLLPAQERIFYEHIKISQSTETLNTELPAKGRFGMGVAAIGDLDGDGVTEIAVSSPEEGTGGIRILFMEKDGTIKRHKMLGEKQGGFSGTLTPGGLFGSKIAAAGDWNKDGIPDLWVGEPAAKVGPLIYGAAWLLLLNEDGTVKKTHKFDGRTEGLIGQIRSGYRFGADISALGDLDGDGVGDVAVGTPMDPNKSTGEVWILLLNADGTVRLAHNLVLEGLRRGDEFGIAVEGIGDLNEDGIPDLAVGADRDDQEGVNQGALYICFLNNNGTVKSYQKIVSNSSGFSGYLDSDDRMGVSLAIIGDMNGDTIPDLAVGAYLDDDESKDKGAVYILFLNRDGTVKHNHKISQTSRNFEGKLTGQYHWAWSVAALGDLNEDGRNDLLVSGFKDPEGGTEKGAFWMLFPADYPERLLEKGTWAEGAGTISASDSARIYAQAKTAEDSARIDSMYDLSGFAPNNLIFVLDVSASMNRPTKLPVLKEAFTNLLPFMRPEDKISVITYSGKAAVQLSGVPASEQKKIIQTLEDLKSSGDTKPEKALRQAYDIAEAHYIPNANNRIIFATDGGFDMRDVNKAITKFANEEVVLSVFYFGKLPAQKIGEMREIANLGKGNSAHITSSSAIGALLREIKVISLKE